MKLILASASPRRSEILSNAGYGFYVCPSEADENITEQLSPAELVKELARLKARDVFSRYGADDVVVLGADTIVVLNGQVLGKPKDKKEAFEMLSSLSGNKHEVYTGVCGITKSEEKVFLETTEVKFFELTESQINAYISTEEPMDKAGAYGIQGNGSLLIKSIKGDFYSVMGLPIARTARLLKSFGIENFML